MTTSTPNDGSYIFDPERPEELVRLIDWDRLTTHAMGGPLQEQSEASIAGLHQILDLACGPGGWVLDTAFALPKAEIAGVDISKGMIEYANSRARSQGLNNASFEVMDITRPFSFSDASFDLVNARSVVTVLHQESWSHFLAECTRILRPGGILRVTEIVAFLSTSPAYNEWNGLMLQAMQRIGYGFSTDGRAINVTTILPRLLRRLGYQNVHHVTHSLEASSDLTTWADGYHNIEVAMYMSQPLLTNLRLIEPDALQKLTRQLLVEAHGEDFSWMQHFMTVWGSKP